MLHADKFKTRAAQSMAEMNKITIVTYNWDENMMVQNVYYNR